MEKVYYGHGWRLDSETGVRRQLALLNLTEGYEELYPDEGLYSSFTQLFVEFSLPANAGGPQNGTGLLIRFSYYVTALCFELNESACPLGSNRSATSQDVLDLEVRRILEYRDEDGNGSYEPGEPVLREVSLAQPESSFVALRTHRIDGRSLALPYDRNASWVEGDLTQGALFAGDPLLDELSYFRIAVGNGVPLNLTLDSYLFLQPTSYQGIPLTPSQLKLDIHMEGISYVEDDTALALELALSSTQYRVSDNATGSSRSVYTSSEAAEAFFAWNGSAAVDGEMGTVGSTLVATNDSAATLYLAYPRGERIAHDPVLGLAARSGVDEVSLPDSDSPAADFWVVVLIVSLAAAIAAVTYALLRRLWGGTDR